MLARGSLLLKRFLVFTVTIFVLLGVFVISLSFKYHIDPYSVSKLFFREFALESLELLYKVYDPWSRNRRVSILYSKSYKNCEHFYLTSRQELKAIVKTRKLPWEIVLVSNYNPRKSQYNFYYAPYDPSRILKAYDFLNGLSSISKIENDFERAIALRNFVKSLWKHGTSGNDVFDLQNFDALKIIELSRQGKRFWCQVYALVYTELANYVGLVSRLVMLSKKGYHFDHGVVEVWSNTFGKWILMDPDFNIHYELNGVPLNAVELHNLWRDKKWNLVQVVKGLPRPVGYDVETRSKYKLLDLYAYVRIDLRNDYYWNRYPKGHPSVSDENTLLWFDPSLPPILSFEKKTNKYSNFYWSLNFAQIYVDPYKISDNRIHVCFETLTPWFSHFEIRIDGKKQILLHENFYNWSLHQGMNIFEVCPVNKFGDSGICSGLKIKVLR